MDIRHKIDNQRVVDDVEWNTRRAAWVKDLGDMFELYPEEFWEEADIDKWTMIPVTVERNGGVLRDGGAHIATMISQDHKFVEDSGNIKVEKLIQNA